MSAIVWSLVDVQIKHADLVFHAKMECLDTLEPAVTSILSSTHGSTLSRVLSSHGSVDADMIPLVAGLQHIYCRLFRDEGPCASRPLR